jgi:thiamine-phosphate pyrophosphorylase
VGTTDPKIERLIDANINRLREGVRVLEDLHRYLFDDADLSAELKEVRHAVRPAYSSERLRHRDSVADVQKGSTASEMERESVVQMLIANFARTQEAARVLEETYKLLDTDLSARFKEIRYRLYDLEKRSLLRYGN